MTSLPQSDKSQISSKNANSEAGAQNRAQHWHNDSDTPKISPDTNHAHILHWNNYQYHYHRSNNPNSHAKHHQNKGPKTDASTTNVSHARETQVPDPLTGKASICSISIRGRKSGRNQSMDSLQSRPPCQCWLRMISKLCSAPPPPWIIQCHTRPGNECQSETPAASGTQVLSTTVVTYWGEKKSLTLSVSLPWRQRSWYWWWRCKQRVNISIYLYI